MCTCHDCLDFDSERRQNYDFDLALSKVQQCGWRIKKINQKSLRTAKTIRVRPSAPECDDHADQSQPQRRDRRENFSQRWKRASWEGGIPLDCYGQSNLFAGIMTCIRISTYNIYKRHYFRTSLLIMGTVSDSRLFGATLRRPAQGYCIAELLPVTEQQFNRTLYSVGNTTKVRVVVDGSNHEKIFSDLIYCR